MPGISEFAREEEAKKGPEETWLFCPVAGCDFRTLPEGEGYRNWCGCRHTEPLVRKEEKEKREESL